MAGEIETSAMANCMKILQSAQQQQGLQTTPSDPTCVFACKTCDRKFPSFQALGGHRASHKKIKTVTCDAPAPVKTPKSHTCPICGQEFLIGQALGGHMRRHRQHPSSAAANSAVVAAVGGGGSSVTTEGSTENSDGNNCVAKKRKSEEVLLRFMPEKSTSEELNDVVENKRVCLDLTLNLFPAGNFEKDGAEDGIEEGEIVEEVKDFLKLELRQPINW